MAPSPFDHPRLKISPSALHPSALRRLAGACLSVLLAAMLTGAEPARRSYDLPGTTAEVALKELARQSGLEVLFVSESVANVRTHGVKGTYTAREALDLMLADTSLVAVQDAASGALRIQRTSDPKAQGAAPAVTSARPKTAPASEEIPIVLSPFEVASSKDTGYVASQTLGGTRLASDIRNVAAQIQVMTLEFLEDIAAVTLDEANLYSLNVENHTEYAANTEGDGADGVERLNQAQRVRGLANASTSRDFFDTFFQLDSYNSERFTYSSGPNAILFGLGSPGGVIDQSLKRARFRDANSVKLRADSNDSYRAEIDVNRVVFKDTLAVRFAAVYDRGESWRKPSLDQRRRQFGTITYRPFQNTTIRASYENVRRDASIPRNTLLKDFVTPFLDFRAAEMQRLGITDPSDPRLYWAPANMLRPGETSYGTGNSTGTRAVTQQFVFLNTGQVDPSTPGSALIFRANGSARSASVGELRSSPDNGPSSVTNQAIFPYDINVGGMSTMNRQEGNIATVAIEQKITSNFFIEAAFNRESYTQDYTDWVRGTDQNLRIDVNRYLPNIRDAAGNAILNPNRGRYYIESFGRGSFRSGEIEEGRLTASYKLDFTRRDGWTKWLGRHSLAGLFDFRDAEVRDQNFRSMVYEDDGTVNIQNRTARTNRQTWYRVYLDQPGQGTSFYDTNRHVTALSGDTYGTYTNLDIGLVDPKGQKGYWSAGTVTADENRGQMLAVQSELLRDRVVVTYGKRWDAVKTKRSQTPTVNSTEWYRENFVSVLDLPAPDPGINPDLDANGAKDTRGIVVFPLKFLSLHYNESSNQRASAGGFNPNGGFNGPSAGTGKDYGFGLALLDSRLFVKTNWYENAQTNNSSGEFNTLVTMVGRIEGQLEDKAALFPSVGYRNSETWNQDTQASNTPVLSDFRSKGIEFTVTANPSRGWRLSVTAAKIESVETNIATTWDQYVATRLPEWKKFYDYPYENDAPVPAQPGVETVQQRVERTIFYEQLDRAKLVDGRPTRSVPAWRANVVTNYEFQRSWLKGFGVGGAYRWRDRAAIGLPMITGPDGNPIQDIDNPYLDDGTKNIDAWVSYRTKLFGNRIRARFQVNVRNVLDDRDLIPQSALTTGERALFRPNPPREMIFSAIFDF